MDLQNQEFTNGEKCRMIGEKEGELWKYP